MPESFSRSSRVSPGSSRKFIYLAPSQLLLEEHDFPRIAYKAVLNILTVSTLYGALTAQATGRSDDASLYITLKHKLSFYTNTTDLQN